MDIDNQGHYQSSSTHHGSTNGREWAQFVWASVVCRLSSCTTTTTTTTKEQQQKKMYLFSGWIVFSEIHSTSFRSRILCTGISAHTVWHHHHHGHYSQKGNVLVLSMPSQYVFMYMNDAHFICKNKPFPPHEWWSVMRAILERLVGGPAVHTCPLDTWSVGQVLSLSVMPHDNWQFPLSSIPPPLLPMPWHFLLRLSFV